MRYPTPLVPGAAIGVTAPSSGVSMLAHLKRLDLVLSQLSARGFEIVEGQCLRSDHHHVSAPAAARTKDLQALWMDDRVRAIIPPWGGVLLIDCLHQLDFERLAQSSAPKWLVGYSDTSTLLFAVTSMLDIATAHGPNLMELIDTQPDDLTARTLGCLATRPGEAFEQSSFPRYQTRWTRWDDDRFDAPLTFTEPSQWSNLGGGAHETFSGRLIGGCLDTLVHLVGTPYGPLPEFIARHRDAGVVLYLEVSNMRPASVARSLWQMRYADWFSGLSGVVFGRSNGPEVDPESIDEKAAIASVLGNLAIPVLFDADIGHKPPQMVLLNGSVARFEFDSGRARVVQRLE